MTPSRFPEPVVIVATPPECERDDEFEAAYRLAMSASARERKKGWLAIVALLLNEREWPGGVAWGLRLAQVMVVNGPPNLSLDGNRRGNRRGKQHAKMLPDPTPSRDDAVHRAYKAKLAEGRTPTSARTKLVADGIPDPHNRRVTLPLTVDSIRKAIQRDKARRASDPRWVESSDALAALEQAKALQRKSGH